MQIKKVYTAVAMAASLLTANVLMTCVPIVEDPRDVIERAPGIEIIESSDEVTVTRYWNGSSGFEYFEFEPMMIKSSLEIN